MSAWVFEESNKICSPSRFHKAFHENEVERESGGGEGSPALLPLILNRGQQLLRGLQISAYVRKSRCLTKKNFLWIIIWIFFFFFNIGQLEWNFVAAA